MVEPKELTTIRAEAQPIDRRQDEGRKKRQKTKPGEARSLLPGEKTDDHLKLTRSTRALLIGLLDIFRSK
jgi:hypothetical protein